MKRLSLVVMFFISLWGFTQNEIGNQLIKSTVRIINHKNNNSLTVGTGFFFSYTPDTSWHGRIEVIVTNKHMASNSSSLILNFRSKIIEIGKEKDSSRVYELQNPSSIIYNHPDSTVDLCVIFLRPITEYFLNTYHEKLNITYFTNNLIPDSKTIKSFSSIEDVIMIGYPEGIIEPNSLYPIVRKGITATPFNVDFNNKKEFLTDIFAIGGSSGSPVILFRKGYYQTKGGRLSQIVDQPYLLGIHYAGFNNNKINLGVNIKSSRIIEILDSFITLCLKDPKQREFLENLKKENPNQK